MRLCQRYLRNHGNRMKVGGEGLIEMSADSVMRTILYGNVKKYSVEFVVLNEELEEINTNEWSHG